MTPAITTAPALVASGAFSNNSKTEPAAFPLAINIPAKTVDTGDAPTTPPMLSTSVSSAGSFDSFGSEADEVDVAAAAARSRRQSQQFFFPHQTKFESAVPVVTRARDIHLKDHPFIEGAYAEYEKLYNADSLITKDGRQMVRLL
ncbi:hypothetical protein BX616_010326 [Lobosporangium transversale]|nr:hypothetical protein BX616_010326 [Lobosporangium transversale]